MQCGFQIILCRENLELGVDILTHQALIIIVIRGILVNETVVLAWFKYIFRYHCDKRAIYFQSVLGVSRRPCHINY